MKNEQNNTQYQKGQKITFKCDKSGDVFTKKIQWVYVNPFSGEVSLYIRPTGSGTNYESVYVHQIIAVK